VSPKNSHDGILYLELIPEIEKEVNKLIEATFLHDVKYPTWVPNIIPISKKNGQLCIYMDFRDLNNTYPKDDFSLLVMECMIDFTSRHGALSFMDCTTSYNQIQIAPEDQEATVFCTPKGIFCYKVIPFDLNNTGATYQRQCKPSLRTCYTKLSSAMLMIKWLSKKRGQTTCMIYDKPSRDYEGDTLNESN